MPPAEQKRHCKDYSAHVIESAFWGLGVVDVHEKIMHESLHNNHLGVSPAIVRMLGAYIAEAIPRRKDQAALESKLNAALHSFPRWSPFGAQMLVVTVTCHDKVTMI